MLYSQKIGRTIWWLTQGPPQAVKRRPARGRIEPEGRLSGPPPLRSGVTYRKDTDDRHDQERDGTGRNSKDSCETGDETPDHLHRPLGGKGLRPGLLPLVLGVQSRPLALLW